MLRYDIKFNHAELLSAAINNKVMPLLSQTVDAVAQATSASWSQAVMHAKLRSGEKDAYSASIKIDKTGPLSAVVWTDYKHAEEIETGRQARDLKKMLDTSMKVRLTKSGTRYLIIPFRHNTPGNSAHAPAMSQAVYSQAKLLSPSRITGQGTRLSGTGAWSMSTKSPATVAQNKYQWGGKLKGPGIPKHQQGMYRFDTGAGGAKSSAFLTFRVMSEKSKGWIVPAQPGQFIAQGVAQAMQPKAVLAFQEAVKATLGG